MRRLPNHSRCVLIPQPDEQMISTQVQVSFPVPWGCRGHEALPASHVLCCLNSIQLGLVAEVFLVGCLYVDNYGLEVKQHNPNQPWA